MPKSLHQLEPTRLADSTMPEVPAEVQQQFLKQKRYIRIFFNIFLILSARLYLFAVYFLFRDIELYNFYPY